MINFETIQEMVTKIAKQFDPEKIILFGSYAQGNATEDSDIDLLVVTETDLPDYERYAAVRRLLAGYPVAFDIIVKTPEEYQRSRSLVNQIVYFADKYGKSIYER